MRRQMEWLKAACRYRSLAPFCQGSQIRFTSIYLSPKDRTIVMAHSCRRIPVLERPCGKRRRVVGSERCIGGYHEYTPAYNTFSTKARSKGALV